MIHIYQWEVGRSFHYIRMYNTCMQFPLLSFSFKSSSFYIQSLISTVHPSVLVTFPLFVRSKIQLHILLLCSLMQYTNSQLYSCIIFLSYKYKSESYLQSHRKKARECYVIHFFQINDDNIHPSKWSCTVLCSARYIQYLLFTIHVAVTFVHLFIFSDR